MNSSINKFNPFPTIAGYNQVDELKNFIQVCPKEMLDKLKNPILIKNLKEKFMKLEKK